jgi:signal transduction histidine kinase
MEPDQTADGDFPEMKEEIQEAMDITSERLAVLHLRNREVVGRSHPEQPPWPDLSQDWLKVTLPYHGEQLVVALYYRDTREKLKHQAVLLGLAAFCSQLIITAGTWFLVGHVLSPIGELSRQARAAESDLQTRLTAPSSDAELVELVTTLNQFLDGLSRTSEVRSRFYSAASHELRTPLQALSGHLELALNRERSAKEYRQSLEEARDQTKRLIRLTQDLLLLNRLETSSQAKFQTLQLADYCENAWVLYRPIAEEKSLEVNLKLEEACEIQTSPSYLSSLCRNLMENAVKYATPGGRLEIRASQNELRVYNDCAPLRKEDFEKLTEPFFRPDTSRTSATGGNGLGLSLVWAISNHEGWDFRLAQTAEGFEAVVRMPREP